MTEPKIRTIVVAGAGIGGLTAALLLSRLGYRVIVLEKSTHLSSAGAGIQLSPNATRVLYALGLEKALRAYATVPKSTRVFKASNGRQLLKMPLGDEALQRYGHPYLSIHRGDLQKVLVEACQTEPDIELKLGSALIEFAVHKRGVTVQTSDFEEIYARLLIGADGLHSRTRELFLKDGPADYSGFTAWRGLLPSELMPTSLSGDHVNLWLGPNAHLVHYPVNSGIRTNIVAIVKEDQETEGWSNESSYRDFAHQFDSWSSEVSNFLAKVENWRKWSLYHRPAPDRLSNERVILIGDAAHPILPFLAQGGALAIEDAGFFAKGLDQPKPKITDSVDRFEKHRKQRITKIQKQSLENDKRFHAQFPLSSARDFALKMVPGKVFLSRYDWLYGYDPLSNKVSVNRSKSIRK